MPATHTSIRLVPTTDVGSGTRRRARRLARLVLAGLTGLVIACEDTGNGPDPVDPPAVAGRWTGQFQQAGGNLAADFTFTQSDFVVGGTASIESVLPSSPIEAAIDGNGRVVMLIENGCEVWLGTMTVSSDETRMQGPLQVDRSACPTGPDDTGILVLNR